jgi:TusA-related sulfurtransferase
VSRPPRHLDVTGTFCPIPVLLGAREMGSLRVGEVLELVGDDPAMLEDIPAWCAQAGHRLIELVEEDGGKIRALVEKGARRRPAGSRA